MAWKTASNPALGLANFNPVVVDTTAVTPVGTIACAYDDVYGMGEFIYLPGVAATVSGDLVHYDLSPVGVVTTRAVSAAGVTNSGRPLAVALGAVLAGQFGWYQIAGVAIVNVAAGAVAGVAGLTGANAGSLTSTLSAGNQVLGARLSSAIGVPAAGKAYYTMNRPCMQGQIT